MCKLASLLLDLLSIGLNKAYFGPALMVGQHSAEQNSMIVP